LKGGVEGNDFSKKKKLKGEGGEDATILAQLWTGVCM